jgi:hypothetical protein
MAAASHGGRNGFSSTPSPPPAASGRRALFSAIATGALLVLLSGYWWWTSSGEGREIRDLPPAQRKGLYQRTMENLKTICDPAPGRSMREFCRRQAALAVEFPECDDDCHRIARRHLSLPRQ